MVSVNNSSGQEFQALTQVLDAEKAAQVLLDDALKQAETLLQDAQIAARDIQGNTDRRIQALHDRFRKNLKAKKTRYIDDFHREKGGRGVPVGTEKVKEATGDLARYIVGVSLG